MLKTFLLVCFHADFAGCTIPGAEAQLFCRPGIEQKVLKAIFQRGVLQSIKVAHLSNLMAVSHWPHFAGNKVRFFIRTLLDLVKHPCVGAHRLLQRLPNMIVVFACFEMLKMATM